MRTEPGVRGGWWLPFLLLTLGSLSLGALSLVPAEALARRANGAAVDGQVVTFARLHEEIVLRSRILAALVGTLALGTLVGRRAVGRWLAESLASASAALRRLRRPGLARALPAGDALALAGLVFLGAWLRARHLGLPLDTDEAQTVVSYVSRPWYVGIAFYGSPNNHLLHTLLAHGVFVLGGWDGALLRLPALAAGVLLIVATWAFALVAFNRPAALLAAALTATSPILVFYSVRARGYMLLCLLFMALLLVSHYQAKRWNPGAWAVWAALIALGAFTVPTMAYGVAIVALWLAIAAVGKPPGSSWRRAQALGVAIGLAAALTLFLYLPTLLVSGPARLVANPWIERAVVPRSPSGAATPAYAAAVWSFLTAGHSVGAGAVLATGAAIGCVAGRRIGRLGAGLPIAAVAAPLTALWLSGVAPPGRIWVFLWPLFLVLAAAGLSAPFAASAWGRRRATRLLFTIGVCALAVVAALNPRTRDLLERARAEAGPSEPEALMAYLGVELGPGDAVIATERLMHPVRYEFARRSLPLGQVNPATVGGGRVFLLVHEGRQTMDAVAGYASGWDLDRYLPPHRIAAFGNVTVYLSAPPGLGPLHASSSPAGGR